MLLRSQISDVFVYMLVAAQMCSHMTNTPTAFANARRRMLASLDNVLDSRESPLEIKEPMALKFLPHSLLEELRIVKMSQKLGMHPLLHMLMDDAGPQTLVRGGLILCEAVEGFSRASRVVWGCSLHQPLLDLLGQSFSFGLAHTTA